MSGNHDVKVGRHRVRIQLVHVVQHEEEDAIAIPISMLAHPASAGSHVTICSSGFRSVAWRSGDLLSAG